MMEARFTEIERDNRLLLEKMTVIMKNKSTRPGTTQPKPQCKHLIHFNSVFLAPNRLINLYNDKRKQSLMKITLEN